MRRVWIDAICINQDNLDERSQQVSLMTDIYSKARRVIIWLGEDWDRKASMAIRIMKKAAEQYYVKLGETLEDLTWDRTLDLHSEHQTLFYDNYNDLEMRKVWEALFPLEPFRIQPSEQETRERLAM